MHPATLQNETGCCLHLYYYYLQHALGTGMRDGHFSQVFLVMVIYSIYLYPCRYDHPH